MTMPQEEKVMKLRFCVPHQFVLWALLCLLLVPIALWAASPAGSAIQPA